MQFFAIQVVMVGSSLRFRLITDHGLGIRVLGVSLQEASTQEYLWALSAPGLSISIEKASIHTLSAEAIAEAPRIAEAEARYADSLGEHGVWLEELVYGEVPRGLVQAIPALGPPPPLLPGNSYVIVASGDQVGFIQFTA